MKILSLNTWTEKGPWRKRWEIIFKLVGEIHPDFIAFQEIFNPEWTNKIQEWTGYESLVYLPESKISGLAVLSNCPSSQAEIFKYKMQSSDMEPRRYLLSAEFEFQNQKILFCNTHLTWRVNESKIRIGQVDEILQFIEKRGSSQNVSVQLPSSSPNDFVGDLDSRLKHAGMTTGPERLPQKIIVCGDFNASADTPEIKKIAAAGFVDTFSAVNPGSEALTWDNANPYAASASSHLPDRRIDFIFTRGFGTPKTSRIVLKKPNEKGLFASDHYGVLTEF